MTRIAGNKNHTYVQGKTDTDTLSLTLRFACVATYWLIPAHMLLGPHVHIAHIDTDIHQYA